MSQDEKNIILRHLRHQYWCSDRVKKSQILDQVTSMLGCHRKHANRLLRSLKLEKAKPGPTPVYTDDGFTQALKEIWLATDQLCSKRLKAALPLWLPYYEQSIGELLPEIRNKLLTISPATIDRVLKPYRVRSKRGLAGTKPGTLLKNQIPIQQGKWDVTQPGFVEADTVAHCGNSLAGDFVWSLTITDIYSAWTENRACWNKGAHAVVEQIKNIEENLPFALQGFDCDNGSEFLNYHLLRYFQQRHKVIQFTRSRPYHKNDNAHVEQKNWTHVRHLLGYDRLDKRSIVPLINDLYANEWSLYQNYFCPTMKLLNKTKLNSKYQRHYEQPQTPYQRLMASQTVSEEKKAILKKTFEALNPFELKAQIENKLQVIFRYVSVTSNVRQRI